MLKGHMSRRTFCVRYKTLLSSIVVACLLGVFGIGKACRAADGAPALEVDASWPQPLPNKWAIGQVTGIALGPQDHVWILHRPSTLDKDEIFAAANPPSAECCIPAPPVIEFDASGKVVRAWGGPGAGYEWPLLEHGLFVDYKGNVWISGNGGKGWGRILKFTADGKFLIVHWQAARARREAEQQQHDQPRKPTRGYFCRSKNRRSLPCRRGWRRQGRDCF